MTSASSAASSSGQHHVQRSSADVEAESSTTETLMETGAGKTGLMVTHTRRRITEPTSAVPQKQSSLRKELTGIATKQ